MIVKACSRCGGPVSACSCAARENRRRAVKAAANGLGSAYWKRLRVASLVRDGGRCVLRVDQGCTRVATTVHIRPGLGGDHLRARLEDCSSCCAHCHGVIDAPRAARGVK